LDYYQILLEFLQKGDVQVSFMFLRNNKIILSYFKTIQAHCLSSR
jgi:hypothetical protein